MQLRLVVAVLALLFGTAVQAQTPPAASSAGAGSTPPKAAAKKSVTKSKSGSKPPAGVESGPCRLGVIAALGNRFSVHKFGLTVFETEDAEVAIEGWGLDELAVARIRAATGADPTVRRISYPQGAFEPYYHPKSKFLPDPNEGLPAVVRSITLNANCERYLVVTKFKGTVSGTKMEINGIGVYSQGIGSLVRHAHLFANVGITILDGRTFERINPSLSAIGSSLSQAFQLVEDPLTKLDHSLFPVPPETASTSAILKERTRALVSAKLDRLIKSRLQE